MENTEPVKSVEEIVEKFESKFVSGINDGFGNEKKVVNEPDAVSVWLRSTLHSYTASREKKAYLEGRESRQSEVDFLREEAYGDVPPPHVTTE